MRFFESALFEFFFQKKKLLHLNENKQPVHMRYHLFLHYGWFLQNFGKDFIRTNMHTTVLQLIQDNLRRVRGNTTYLSEWIQILPLHEYELFCTNLFCKNNTMKNIDLVSLGLHNHIAVLLVRTSMKMVSRSVLK